MNKAELLLSSQNLLGECPRWHPDENKLYWVDIERGQIHSYSLEEHDHQIFELGLPVGCLAFRRPGGLLLATSIGFAYWSRESGIAHIVDPEPDREDARFNDGAVDPKGRFWAGTMTSQGSENSLYRFDPDESVRRMESGIAISNGIGWSPDHRILYFTDSPRKTIYAYDFDLEGGTLFNRRPWVESAHEPGVPDGLAVDVEGCVWSARWDGWKIQRYDPKGDLMQEVMLPCQRPTSCTFGGSDLEMLLITSARTELSEQQLRAQPTAGDLFYVETNTHGRKENFFQGDNGRPPLL